MRKAQAALPIVICVGWESRLETWSGVLAAAIAHQARQAVTMARASLVHLGPSPEMMVPICVTLAAVANMLSLEARPPASIALRVA